MYIRRVKRKCGIRGCKNTDCFAVSRNREIGNTVILCRDCLKEALKAVDNLPDGVRTNAPEKQTTDAPPLFFGDVLHPKKEDTPSASPEKESGKSENNAKQKNKKEGMKNEHQTEKKATQ